MPRSIGGQLDSAATATKGESPDLATRSDLAQSAAPEESRTTEQGNEKDKEKKENTDSKDTDEKPSAEEKKLKEIEERKAKAHARYMRYFRSIRSTRLRNQLGLKLNSTCYI